MFDTNTIISGFLFAESNPAKALQRVLQTSRLQFSEATFRELVEVLRRSKFDRYVVRFVRESFLITLAIQSDFIDVAEQIRECRDPKDDKILEIGVAANATCIVSGDQDLLALNPFRGIPILTPAQFLASP